MAVSRPIQARVSPEIYEAANTVLKASGLTCSDVIRVLMTRIATDKELPKEIFGSNPKMTARQVWLSNHPKQD